MVEPTPQESSDCVFAEPVRELIVCRFRPECGTGPSAQRTSDRVLSARLRRPEGQGGGRGSEGVTLGQPVMPVADGFDGCRVDVNGGQLRQRNGKVAALPANQDEHVGGAGIFGAHAPCFDGFSLS